MAQYTAPQGRSYCALAGQYVEAHGIIAPGDAVSTPGFNMKAKHIIHTAGPIWAGGGSGEEHTLRKAYENSLDRAAENGDASVAFPAISCGVYGYPIAQAARVALKALRGRARKKANGAHHRLSFQRCKLYNLV